MGNSSNSRIGRYNVLMDTFGFQSKGRTFAIETTVVDDELFRNKCNTICNKTNSRTKRCWDWSNNRCHIQGLHHNIHVCYLVVYNQIHNTCNKFDKETKIDGKTEWEKITNNQGGQGVQAVVRPCTLPTIKRRINRKFATNQQDNSEKTKAHENNKINQGGL